MSKVRLAYPSASSFRTLPWALSMSRTIVRSSGKDNVVSSPTTILRKAGVPFGMPQASVSYRGERLMRCTARRDTSVSSNDWSPRSSQSSRSAKLVPSPMYTVRKFMGEKGNGQRL